MAEVIGRSGLIISGLSQQKRHRSPIRAAGVTRVRMVNRFPSVKLKASSLRPESRRWWLRALCAGEEENTGCHCSADCWDNWNELACQCSCK